MSVPHPSCLSETTLWFVCLAVVLRNMCVDFVCASRVELSQLSERDDSVASGVNVGMSHTVTSLVV